MADCQAPIAGQKTKLKKRLIFITGPTAVGKSKVAIQLAKLANAEIISCDSMQLYQGMDILTSKPPVYLRKRIKHHLIGLIPPTKEYNVSKYRREAISRIKKIISIGKVPVFCGGTGLYLAILIDGIFNEKTASIPLRKEFYRQLEKYGRDYLYKKLERIDKASAKKIHPNDTRRIIRALEVFKATGKPISALQKERKGLSDDFEIKIFCLNMERAMLYERIDKRVDDMFKGGLIDEVKRLSKKRLSKTATCAIGISELKGYFKGRYDLEEAKRLIKRNTRRYAKRQLSWFRKDKRLDWVNIKERDSAKEIARRLWKKLC